MGLTSIQPRRLLFGISHHSVPARGMAVPLADRQECPSYFRGLELRAVKSVRSRRLSLKHQRALAKNHGLEAALSHGRSRLISRKVGNESEAAALFSTPRGREESEDRGRWNDENPSPA